MKISPRVMAITYFIMGVLFTYLAIKNTDEYGWNIVTFIFAFIATLDFGASFRYFRTYFKRHDEKRK